MTANTKGKDMTVTDIEGNTTGKGIDAICQGDILVGKLVSEILNLD